MTMRYKRNRNLVRLAEECGFYIDITNPEVTWKEVEFLCESAIRRCAELAAEEDFAASDVILKEFGLDGVEE